MDKIFQGAHDHAKSYIDDIVIFSKTWDLQVAHIREVLDRVRRAHLTVNVGKCCFAQRQLKCLGHILEDGKILTDDDKIKAIVELQPPKPKRQVCKIHRCLGYYQQYLKKCQVIAQPITDLLHKAQRDRVRWGPKQQEAFDAVKSVLITKPALIPSDHSAGYIMQCDSSDYGWGVACYRWLKGKSA